MSREQFWFFHPFRVRYSEIDGQGVVFNAHYLTYFDTTITEYFRALGYDQFADAKATGIDFHVVKSVIEYKAPVLFDWELEVGARVARITGPSMPRVSSQGLTPGGQLVGGGIRCVKVASV